MPTLRSIQEHDLQEVRELLDGIFRRPRGVMDQSMLTDFPLVFIPTNWRNCRVVMEEGRIVAHAALWRREVLIEGERFVVGVLACVATHVDYRHRGYAAQAVQSLQDLMHEEGYGLGLLWTAVPDFYHKLGWETAQPAGALITLQAGSLAADSEREYRDYDVSPFVPQHHQQAVYNLHEREPIRFHRPPEESRTLLALPKIETWVASKQGEVAAYLVHAVGCNKHGLIEYGGECGGIIALIRHVLGQQPADKDLVLLAYHTRPDLLAWARQLGLPQEPLASSKGFGCEMLLPIRQPIPAPVRRQLFTWGLDQA